VSNRPSVYKRIQRRETHSPRSDLAITLAVVLILALAYLVTEIVLAACGQKALLLAPVQMVSDIVHLYTVRTSILELSGGVLVIVGLVLVVAALSPGRRARHVQYTERAVVVIDNEVIASALVRVAADEAGVDPDNALGAVSRHRVLVRITPASGVPVDRTAVTAAVRERLDAWGLQPALKPRVVIEKIGRVGA
jgi:hypothetical protein